MFINKQVSNKSKKKIIDQKCIVNKGGSRLTKSVYFAGRNS